MSLEYLASTLNITLPACVMAVIVSWISLARIFGRNRFLYGFSGLLGCAIGLGLTFGILTAIFRNFRTSNLIPLGSYGQAAMASGLLLVLIFSVSELPLLALHKKISKRQDFGDLDETGQNLSENKNGSWKIF